MTIQTKRKGDRAEREFRKAARASGYIVHKSYVSKSSADVVLYPKDTVNASALIEWGLRVGEWHTEADWPPMSPLWVQVKNFDPKTFAKNRTIPVRELERATDVPLGYVRLAAVRECGIGRRRPRWHFWIVEGGTQ